MSDPPRTDIRLGSEVDNAEDLPDALLLKRATAEGLHEIHTAYWPTSVKSLDVVGTPLARVMRHDGESALYETEGVLFKVGLWGSDVYVAAAGRSRLGRDRVELRHSDEQSAGGSDAGFRAGPRRTAHSLAR